MSERTYKRQMTEADKQLGNYLQDVLDREDTAYDEKLEIIKWFDSFDYPKNETIVDGILRCADALNW